MPPKVTFLRLAAKFAANFVLLVQHGVCGAGACQMKSSEQGVNCLSLATT
jgi:hypothetical protein